jgi:hypothetical protein
MEGREPAPAVLLSRLSVLDESNVEQAGQCLGSRDPDQTTGMIGASRLPAGHRYRAVRTTAEVMARKPVDI